MPVIVQKIKKVFPTSIATAIRYYAVMSALGEWHLTEREIELVAFTAIRGTISSGGAKETFIQMFSSSMGTIANMKGKLLKKRLLTEKDRKVTVNPQILLDFSSPLIIQISMHVKQAQ